VRQGLHALADERSLALHRAVAERLERNGAIVEKARERVLDWHRTGLLARPLADAWLEILGRPLPELMAFLVDPGERARRLRQASPFAGVLDARTRWRIWRDVRAAWERA
jgi:hypothetical protein